jgi:2-amino-4-hydroxy-6-hydroxymethyldihydropteridine diphosphokinase
MRRCPSPVAVPAYIALGSNRGDRAAAIAAALAALPGLGVEIQAVSRLLDTAPVGASGRRHFLNCVARVSTGVPPRLLLRRLLALERRLGRHHNRRQRANAPRTLDLDLLSYGRLRLCTPDLTLPHPRARQRWFIRAALAELGASQGLIGSGRLR